MALLVSGVYLDDDPRVAVAARLGVEPDAIRELCLVRRSLDARRRPPRVVANFRVALGEDREREILGRRPPGVRALAPEEEGSGERPATRPASRPPSWTPPSWMRPVVVGAGPAGLFAALCLAESGARPTLLERGDSVEERKGKVARFWRRGELDPESNVLFGEGGAGAFSDGKLTTRRKDPLVRLVLSRLVDLGAPAGILQETHPHLGTDRLLYLLKAMRRRLEELGATIRFRTRVESLLLDGGGCQGVRLASGEEILARPVFLATGHSARDMFRTLISQGLAVEVRPTAIGARIEHPRRLVDMALHGESAPRLPPASYRLVARGGRAWTFCMCPGGLVIPASNLDERVVVNGMSMSSRGSRWSNAAVVVPVDPAEVGIESPEAWLGWFDELERRAFSMGGGGFKAPAQGVADFLEGRRSVELPPVSHPLGVAPSDLRGLLPPPIASAMAAAIREFDDRIPGFAGAEGVIVAPESRTSSPLRLPRSPEGEARGVPWLYPVGEGAGWAGGITTAAADGWRSAEAAMAKAG